MPNRKIAGRTKAKLTPHTTIAQLANNTILDALTGPQLVIYLRLVAATAEQRSRTVHVLNSMLYRDTRTATRALVELEQMRLVKLSYGRSALERAIEVAS